MKKLISFLLTIVMMCGVATHVFSADGTVPYGYTPIRTAQELDNIRNNLSGKYILMNDIDLGEYENWVPIGGTENPFEGILVGNNHSINNLKSVVSENTPFFEIGLFGCISDSVIAGIKIKSIYIKAINTDYIVFCVGGISATASKSTVSNCSVTGELYVSCGQGIYVGGIVGRIKDLSDVDSDSCVVMNCISDCSINVKGQCDNSPVFDYPVYPNYKSTEIGGIIGGNEKATIFKCANRGSIAVDAIEKAYIGGIAGVAQTIENCVNYGSIICKANNAKCYDGGIAGKAKNTTNCINTKEVKAEADIYTGGIMGESFGERTVLKNCYYPKGTAAVGNNVYNNVSINATALDLNDMSKRSKLKGLDFNEIWTIKHNLPTLQQVKALPDSFEISLNETFALPAEMLFCSIINSDIAEITSDNSIIGKEIGETKVVMVSADGEHKTADLKVVKTPSFFEKIILFFEEIINIIKRFFSGGVQE